jgi:membrane protease YdiL (CAAX protease family)
MELFNFIRTGEFTKSKPTAQRLLLLLFTYFILVIPILLFLVVLNAFNLIPEHISQKEIASLKYILSVIMFGPIIEELIFRLLLIPKFIYISFSLSLFIVATSKSIWGTNYWYEWYLMMLPVFGLIYYTFKKISFNVSIPIKYLVHITVIIFAFNHIVNFIDMKIWMYFLTPILTAPQILMGYILSHTRLKYGFLFAVLLHILINFTLSLPLIIKYISTLLKV